MNLVNYNTLLDRAACAWREEALAARNIAIDELYRSGDGVRYASRSGQTIYSHEVFRLAENALLLSTDCAVEADTYIQQIVDDGDWVHLQFRLNGEANERCSTGELVATPAGSCLVGRYPDQTLVERGILTAERSRYACLFMKPRAVLNLLDASAEDLPARAAWIAAEGARDLRISVLPLHSAMSLAVIDVLECSFRGSARRAYLRAKSIELLSTVIHALNEEDAEPLKSHERLSTSDLVKIGTVRTMLIEGSASSLSLSQLARRVGLNRAKLAYGFKHVYGVPVAQYRRDASLERAYRLLQQGRASVTDIAFELGYRDPSSFTRAFNRKFGMLPRACKQGSSDSLE